MNKTKVKYSVVVPVYGCKKCLEELTTRVDKVLSDYELILVDDCANENAWPIIEGLSKNNNRIKGIRFSRNFGQHYAITAGLSYAKGEWIIVMDCDLQDLPEEIPKLIKKTQDNFDIVPARRVERHDSFFKKLGSKLYYKTFSYFTDTKQDHTIANFGVYHRKVIDSILAMKDQVRYFPTMVQWVGFNKIAIDVKHASRQEGKSSYNLKKLFELAFNNIIAFSDKPLRLTIKFGFFISLVTFGVAIFYFIQYLRGEIFQLGFTSLILSIWFLSGITMAILGIIGIYIGKTFEKVKDRPQFLIKETTNFDDEK